MIPENRGISARFERTQAGNTTHFDDFQVVAWDDEGFALVANEITGRLDRACTLDGFQGLDRGFAPLGVVPGNGWRVVETYADGSRVTLPVIAWMISESGYARPIVDTGGGLVAEIEGDDWAPIAPGEDKPVSAEDEQA